MFRKNAAYCFDVHDMKVNFSRIALCIWKHNKHIKIIVEEKS